uniref:F-box domain-containing protein n=1 Tax=Caenorhabditis tropicalis TaxID=1561998 RepID=A0A1I7UA05_9PELO
MNRFALFQLPFVAISEVMKKFNLIDITMLSLCSQRTQRWIKSCRFNRDGLKLKVEINEGERICLYNNNQKMEFNITSPPLRMLHLLKIGDSLVPTSIEKADEYALVNMYFDDSIEGMKTVSDYLCSFFEININIIRLSSYT